MTGQLIYNEDSGRIELGGNELHAGDAIKVLTINQAGSPEWAYTRIEYDHARKAWYLVGLSGYQANGLIARIRE